MQRIIVLPRGLRGPNESRDWLKVSLLLNDGQFEC